MDTAFAALDASRFHGPAVDMATLLGPADPEVQANAQAAREILVRLEAAPFIHAGWTRRWPACRSADDHQRLKPGERRRPAGA